MKKRFLCALAALLLMLGAAVPALAADQNYIYDVYGLLSQDEIASLQSRAAEISNTYDCGLYIVIVKNFSDYGSSASAAAENIYRDNNFGRYTDNSGVLLLMSMSDRDYYVYHLGFGTYAAQRWGASRMDSAMLTEFRNNNWYKGLLAYLDTCNAMLADAESSYDPADYNPDGTPVRHGPSLGSCILRGLFVGCVVAFLVCSGAKVKMRSVRSASNAANYAAAGGITLYQSNDRFSHTTESRVRIESSSSRSGGGGRPSGGGGGHGGKF